MNLSPFPPGIPAYNADIGSYNASMQPNTVHAKNTGLAAYYRKYLFQRLISVYKWTLPDTWAKNYFESVLFSNGYISIINTDKFGVIPQMCGLMGYDVFYQPTNAIISNPLLTGILQPRIGTQCTIIKLQNNYSGALDIVETYAELLAMAMETASVDLVNSKLAYVFGSNNKSGAESLKKLYDTIASGNPAVFYDKQLNNPDGSPNWTYFSQNLKENYIVTDILNDMRNIMNQFDSEIGIPNANTEKRERLISDEVNANAAETRCLSDLWLESLQDGCRRTMDMFGISISVEKRYNNNEEAGDDRNSFNNRIVYGG